MVGPLLFVREYTHFYGTRSASLSLVSHAQKMPFASNAPKR